MENKLCHVKPTFWNRKSFAQKKIHPHTMHLQAWPCFHPSFPLGASATPFPLLLRLALGSSAYARCNGGRGGAGSRMMMMMMMMMMIIIIIIIPSFASIREGFWFTRIRQNLKHPLHQAPRNWVGFPSFGGEDEGKKKIYIYIYIHV